jgi:hypothetical protein
MQRVPTQSEIILACAILATQETERTAQILMSVQSALTVVMYLVMLYVQTLKDHTLVHVTQGTQAMGLLAMT